MFETDRQSKLLKACTAMNGTVEMKNTRNLFLS